MSDRIKVTGERSWWILVVLAALLAAGKAVAILLQPLVGAPPPAAPAAPAVRGPVGFVDQITSSTGTVLVAGNTRIVVPAGVPLSIRGWGMRDRGVRYERVEVVVDHARVVAGRVGLLRPDVAANLGDPAAAGAGYEIVLAPGLAAGRHFLLVRGYARPGRSPTTIGAPFTLTAAAAGAQR